MATTLRIVEVNYDDGSSKYLVEKECKFIWIFSYWKKETVILDSMFGRFETERDFKTYDEAERYVFSEYKDAVLEEKETITRDLMW